MAIGGSVISPGDIVIGDEDGVVSFPQAVAAESLEKVKAQVQREADTITAIREDRYQGDEEIPVKKGDFWRRPGNVPHTMRAGPEGRRVLDVFPPPPPEYRKPGKGFGDT